MGRKRRCAERWPDRQMILSGYLLIQLSGCTMVLVSQDFSNVSVYTRQCDDAL